MKRKRQGSSLGLCQTWSFKLHGWVPKYSLSCSLRWFWIHQHPVQALGKFNSNMGSTSQRSGSSSPKTYHLSVAPVSPPSAVRSTMGAPGMRLALWLLTFSTLMQMLSSEFFSPGVKKELCESGYLGGEQKWTCEREETREGERESGPLDGMAEDLPNPPLISNSVGLRLLIILSSH